MLSKGLGCFLRAEGSGYPRPTPQPQCPQPLQPSIGSSQTDLGDLPHTLKKSSLPSMLTTGVGVSVTSHLQDRQLGVYPKAQRLNEFGGHGVGSPVTSTYPL